MKFVSLACIAAFLAVGTANAEPLALAPADPQPTTGELIPGLAVSYAYGAKGRTLAEAERILANAEPGVPLQGLSYLDTDEGDMALTSNAAEQVAAAISGYILFEEPGTFQVEFISNDGISARIGGQEVALLDGVHGCESAGPTEVMVPAPGWYAVEATYFQRKGSSCLLMDWNVDGEMEPVPDGVFAHEN